LTLLVGLRRFGIDADKGQVTIVAAGQEAERIAGLSTGTACNLPPSQRRRRANPV
jgi:hypothetical protein